MLSRSILNEEGVAELIGKPGKKPKGLAFALVFGSLCVASFLSALDLTAVSTALPTIVAELPGETAESFTWVSSAYSLAGTAILPWTGGLAQIFGRRPLLIASLALFFVGSTVCAAAPNIPVFLLGRTLAGLGDGGIISLAEIITADLVPLSERGTWEGVLGTVWAVASVVGPPISGAITEHSSWRVLFWINLPITAMAGLLVVLFMKMKSPNLTFSQKMEAMDWLGNFLVIGAVCAITLAISAGGVREKWTAAKTMIPLIIGFVTLGIFFFAEFNFISNPTIPKEVVNNRTSALTYIAALLHGAIALAVIYVLPIYFQASLGASAGGSGVKILPLALTIAPAAMVAAVSIEVTGVYRGQNWMGWALTVIGLGLFTLLNSKSRPALWIGAQIPLGIGLGINFTAPQFPVLAPLHPRWAAQALALFTFVSSFGQTFGLVIGDAVLQNRLHKLLPPSAAFLAANMSADSPVSSIPFISTLEEPLRSEVREAFSMSCRTVWIVLLPLAAVGVVTCLGLKAYELHEETDEEYAMVQQTPPQNQT
ncbi:iron permease [Meredithblackwellia eburnea MCA 4105]